MTGFFDDMAVPVVCLACGHEFQKSIAWLDEHSSVECPECHHASEITKSGLDELRRVGRKIDARIKSIGKHR